MKLQPLKKFIKEEAGIKTVLCIILLAISIPMVIINLSFFHYQAVSYIDYTEGLLIMTTFLFFIMARMLRPDHPKSAFFLEALWILAIVSLVVNYAMIAIQYTPFPLQDKFFYHLDGLLGLHIIPIINWTYSHTMILNVFKFTYQSMIVELLFVPVLLALLHEKRNFDVYVISVLLCFIAGSLIYYFFPTTSPAAVIHNSHFTPAMHAVVNRFYDQHNHIRNVNLDGYIIGFPSFHTIWAIIFVWCFRNRAYIFYPLLVFNTILIISTVALGWHFVVDVIGGIILIIIAIFVAERLTTYS